MAIQDDFTIDYVDRKITYTTAFSNDRPPNIYTVNELYSFLQDTFDEPAQMDDPIPMSAQTPTQYTMLYPWFIDNESVKALYGGSIQTSSWTKSAAEGITALRWASATAAPDAADIGKAVTGVTSTATGVILAVDATRQIVWVRNTSAAQFQNGEVIDDDATGTNPDFTTEAEAGFQTGESIWSNLFSVGSKAVTTEIYIGQEPDQLGGTAYHDADADSKFERRIEKIDEWWDTDVDFFTGSPNLLGGAGHFDVLILTQELGSAIDSQSLAVFAREFSRVYTSFELTGGVGNFVVPFASTGADLNSADGPYNALFDNRTGATLEVGDVLENDAGESIPTRLRAVVTAVTGGGASSGNFDYYLIGENEPLATTDRTLVQLTDNTGLDVRDDTTNLDIMGTPTQVTSGPADAQGVTITFADAQVDVDENGTPEEYACTINCNSVALADVYQHVQFLTSRGNQDGTTPNAQDQLLPSGDAVENEAGEFYRAVGDLIFLYDGGQGTQPTEGDLVTNGSGAYGVVVSITSGTTGTGVLTQVKGTWADDDTMAEIDAVASNDVTIMGTPTSVTDNTGAPFGTFAGGRWFVAQGVVLTNVPTADANNWETTDLTGTRRVPPTVRIITFAGLVANDRAAIFEVSTAGGDDINKAQNGVGGAGAALSATSIPLDTNVSLDVPTSGWVRIVDDSSTVGLEYRYEYSDVTLQTITLRTGAGLTGTATSLGSSTVLNDTGAFSSFGTDGNVKIGHEIRNTTDLSIATVLRQIDANSIETTPLTGGTDQTWAASDTWEANQVVVALVDADTLYFPFIDDVAAGATLTAQIKYVSDKDLIARARFSDPDIGGQRILPFELRSVTLTDADLTVTAIRTDDTIAS
jgi:hypothetical protein